MPEVLAAAAIGPGEDFQQVTVWVFEVHAPAAIALVDHARLGPTRIGPVPQALAADPAKGRAISAPSSASTSPGPTAGGSWRPGSRGR
jgi:hypothetical protein